MPEPVLTLHKRKGDETATVLIDGREVDKLAMAWPDLKKAVALPAKHLGCRNGGVEPDCQD